MITSEMCDKGQAIKPKRKIHVYRSLLKLHDLHLYMNLQLENFNL